MTIISTILAAAKAAKVSGVLLVAICTHESGLTNTYVAHDGGSPSIGVCQVKENTARMLGFKGKAKDLMAPGLNAKYAAKYLKYQIDRYGEDNWCKLTAAYNAGSYNESKRVKGKPRNLKYVRLVQKKLAPDYKNKLSCENTEIAEK